MNEWRARRGEYEWQIASVEDLRFQFRMGHLRADDYVWNPLLARWMYARELAELAEVAKRKAAGGWCGLAVAMLLFAFLFEILLDQPVIGAVFVVVAIVAAVGWLVKKMS